MFFLSIFAISRVNAIVKDYSLLGKVIYLDAGHGGVDSGSVSSTFLEKDMNLLLVTELEKILVSKGARKIRIVVLSSTKLEIILKFLVSTVRDAVSLI